MGGTLEEKRESTNAKYNSYSAAMASRPVIDHGRCEAKQACIAVCPSDVFEVRRLDQEDFDQLSVLGKLRASAHRRMTAYAVRADQCLECGVCVTACPEGAITLAEGTPQ